MSLAADMLEDADLVGNCRRLIEKRYPDARSTDRAARERAFAALMRYGYSQGEIRRALNSKGR
jgi:SOS response regulatory protein OraA/RecX